MAPSRLTVTTAATSTDLVTLATVKTMLGITDTSEDARLALFITQASDAIGRVCRRVFAAETVTEVFRLEASVSVPEPAPLCLTRRPVSPSGITVTVEGASIAAEDVEIDPASGLIWRVASGRRTPWPTTPVSVSYTGGYVVPASTPPAVARACVLTVAAYRASTARDPMMKAETTFDVAKFEYSVDAPTASGLPAEAEALLSSFVRVVI